MAIIGSIENQGTLQGRINDANGYLTGVISNAGLLGGQVVAERGLKGDTGDTGATGATGNGISSISKTSTAGLVDTYTITYTDGNSVTFDVTNGQDGTDGQDGHSPVVTASKTGDTTTIYVDGTAIGTITYKMLKKPSIDLALLIKISELLGHDFLRECSEKLIMNKG